MLDATHGWRRFLGHALGFGGPFFLGFYLPGQFNWLSPSWMAPNLFLWLYTALAVICVTLALEVRSSLRGKQTWGKMAVDLLAKTLGVALGLLALIQWFDLSAQVLGGKVLP